MMILSTVLYVGMMAKRVIQQHRFENTELIFPTTPPPPPKVKVTPPPKLPEPPKPVEVKLEAPKINLPKIEKPVLKPIEMEAKLKMPEIKLVKPAITLAPQPKAALAAAMSRANSAAEAFDGACSPGRYVWRHSESECDQAGDGGGHWKSLWRHAGTFRRATWCSRIDGHWERNEVGIEQRCLRARGIGRASWSNGNNAGIRRQGRFRGNSASAGGCDARDDEGNARVDQS